MAPDAGYYCGRFELAASAHHLAGSWSVGVTAGAVLLGVAVGMRRAFVGLLPQPHRGLLESWIRPVAFRWYLPACWVLALWTGVLTHLALDAFTHRTGWGVLRFSWLARDVLAREPVSLPVFQVLQYAGSVVGTVGLGMAYRSRLRRWAGPRVAAGDGRRLAFWGVACLLALAYAVPHGLAWSAGHGGLLAFRIFTFRTAVHASAAMLVLVGAACAAMAGMRRLGAGGG